MSVTDISAWRNFPKARVGRIHKPKTPELFYGIDVPTIVEWCCVSKSTARAYKAGRLKPGKAVQKLMRIHRERAVLPPEWAGWLVKPESIVDPEGNQTDRRQLRMFRLMMDYAHDLARRTGDPREVERFYELLRAA